MAATYKAVRAISPNQVTGLLIATPAHVQIIDQDEYGRRRTRIIAICESANLDNDGMVDRIAAALTRDENGQ